MRMKTITFLSVLLSVSLLSCNKQGAGSAGMDVRMALDSLELKLARVEYRLALEQWEKSTTGVSDSLSFFEDLYRSVCGDEATFTSLRGRRSRLAQEDLTRRYDILYPLVLRNYIDRKARTRPIYDSLVDFFASDWCEYDGRAWPRDLVHQLYTRQTQIDKREALYRAINSPGEGTADLMGRLIRLRNQSARRIGFNDYFNLSMAARLDKPESFLKLVQQIDSATGPEYRQTLEYLQSESKQDVFEQWDMQSRLAEALVATDRYFPPDSQMKFVTRSMAGIGFKLANLPIYFQLQSDSLAPGSASLMIVDAPHDIRVAVNISSGIETTGQMMYSIGRAIQVSGTAQERALLSRETDEAWQIGMGLFFEQLCYNSDWLEAYPGMPSRLIAQFSQAARASELLTIRLLLVDAMFEFEAYRNPNRDLNQLYWDLYAIYTGLPRHDDLTPWATREALVTNPLGAHNRLKARVIAAQTRAYLRENYGSLIDNREVKSFLVHNFFRFGSRYPWQGLLQRGTGREFSPDYLAMP